MVAGESPSSTHIGASMPAKKPPPPDEKPQRERFIETARAIGASEDPEVFERLFEKIVKAPAIKPSPRGDS